MSVVRTSNAPVHGTPALAPAPLGVPDGRLAPPRIFDALISRPHVARQLAQGMGQLTLLCAPPGSGKTTALVQHHQQLSAQQACVRWLSLSEEDNDAQLLQRHLALSLGLPERTAKAPHLPVLFPQHTHFLVDGLELLHTPAARSMAERFLLSLPESSSACATLHHVRGPVLQEARLRGIVQLVGPNSLRWSDTEAHALLGDHWSREQAACLNQRMQGWAAGLRLLQRAPEATYHWLYDPTGSHVLPTTLGEYFEEMLHSYLSAPVLEALMQLSTFERFTPELFTAMPDAPCDWDAVEQLLRWGWFLQQAPTNPPWIHFHPALGQYLRQRLQRYAPARYEALRCFAAQWFAAHGYAEEAVRHAVQLPHAPQSAAIIEQAGAITVDLGAGPDILFNQSLPPAQAAQWPLLFLGQVYFRFRHGRLAEARHMFDAASALTEHFTRTDAVHQRDEVRGWACAIGSVLLTTDDQPIAPQRITELEREYEYQCGHNAVLAVGIASVLAFIWLDEGQYAQAATICSRGLRLHARESTAKVRLFLHMHQANAAIADGTLADASASLAQALHVAQLELSPHSYEVHTLQLLQALVAFERNELATAWQLLEPALRHIPSVYGWTRMYAEVFAMVAQLTVQAGYTIQLEQLLQEAQHLARERNLPRLMDLLKIIRLRELTRSGLWAEAHAWLHDAAFIALTQPSAASPFAHSTQVPALLAAAQLQLDLGKATDALQWLAQLPADWMHTADQRLRFHFYVLQARASYGLRRYKAAGAHLHDALKIAHTGGLVQRLCQERAHIISLSAALQRTRHHVVPPALQYWVEQQLRHAPVNMGSAVSSSPTSQGAPQNAPVLRLSPRESEILSLMAEGCINKEIASQLGIAEDTVKSHRKHIHEKLGVRSRSQAIQKARDWLLL